jgi:hypothetical protein
MLGFFFWKRAPQLEGLLCNTCDEGEEKGDQFSFIFPSNGAAEE